MIEPDRDLGLGDHLRGFTVANQGVAGANVA